VQLADVRLELRPRTAWEAVDLGQLMYRRWWGTLHLAWFLTFLPLAVGLGIVFRERPRYALLALWWLLPLIERVPLHVLGGKVFGGDPTFGDMLGALPKLWSRRILWRQTVARLSPWRGFAAPIAVLEGQGGSAARRRGNTLLGAGQEGSVALGLTFVCWAFQIGLAASALMLVRMLLPEYLVTDVFATLRDHFTGDVTADGPLWPGLVLYVVGCLALSAVGPLYVAANFALYLNRRTFLEGWDVEVAFRSLVRRLAEPARRIGALVLLAAICWGSGGLGSARAQDVGQVPEERERVEAVVAEVLADPDFDRTETVSRPVGPSGVDLGLPGLGLLAHAVRALLVIVAVGGLLILIYQAVRSYERRRDGPTVAATPPPVEVAGLDVRPESLPVDPASAALALWNQGRTRDALGLLYRASIASLVLRFSVPIVDGDTEGVCLDRVVAHGSGEVGSNAGHSTPVGPFTALTGAWQACAYGRRLPSQAEFEHLVESWRRAFAEPVA
jgi:hypothetical protein